MAPVTAEFTVLAEARRGVFSYDQRVFRELSKHLKDGHYELHVERLQASRSVQQNRRYFGVILRAIAESTGYTVDETHEAMKQMFLPKALAFCDGNGEVHGQLVIGGSTRKLKVSEFHDYTLRVERFAGETLGLTFPDLGD